MNKSVSMSPILKRHLLIPKILKKGITSKPKDSMSCFLVLTRVDNFITLYDIIKAICYYRNHDCLKTLAYIVKVIQIVHKELSSDKLNFSPFVSKTFIHNSLNFTNVLYLPKEKKVALVDLEEFKEGVAMLDILCLLSSIYSSIVVPKKCIFNLREIIYFAYLGEKGMFLSPLLFTLEHYYTKNKIVLNLKKKLNNIRIRNPSLLIILFFDFIKFYVIQNDLRTLIEK
ncbi:MAG: hypothetical protein QW076_04350 [Candidatus Anstonellales archaeon]